MTCTEWPRNLFNVYCFWSILKFLKSNSGKCLNSTVDINVTGMAENIFSCSNLYNFYVAVKKMTLFRFATSKTKFYFLNINFDKNKFFLNFFVYFLPLNIRLIVSVVLWIEIIVFNIFASISPFPTTSINHILNNNYYYLIKRFQR